SHPEEPKRQRQDPPHHGGRRDERTHPDERAEGERRDHHELDHVPHSFRFPARGPTRPPGPGRLASTTRGPAGVFRPPRARHPTPSRDGGPRLLDSAPNPRTQL